MHRVSVLLFVFAACLYTQTSNTGTVVGLVTDPSGALVPEAVVQLEDVTTGLVRSNISNAAGRYAFVGVPPGKYSVKATAKGFQQTVVASVDVEVSKSYTIDLQLELGQARQTVEVASAAGAELQTLDSTVGSSLGGDTLQWLPTVTRNVTSLLLLQPTAMPQQGASQSSYLGGQVAGAHSDQNSIMLDGGNISNGVSGNSDYYTNYQGGQEGPIPTPVESIQELRVATSNPTAGFSGASGSETILVTKRGSNQYHGSLYEFLQNDNLNANTWGRNRLGQDRPESRDNRFGGSFGGRIPGLSEKASTFFFMNYEGRRQMSATQVSTTVPTDSLRQGILRFADATGNVISYNLLNSTQCGANGNTVCDPRGKGLNPVINDLWTKYIPAGNNPSGGDLLNTTGFSAAMALPTSSNFAVVRLDHAFGSNWQLTGSYRYFTETQADGRQYDIGGLVKGDTLGKPAVTATIPRQPRYLVLGLTGVITPALTSELNFNYQRDWWYWGTARPAPQVPGTAGALSASFIPVQVSSGSARSRTWNGRTPGVRENLSWSKGAHLLRFGGAFSHADVHFNRDDGQSSLNSLVYSIGASSGVNIPAAYRPPTCSATKTTNCLPSAMTSSWNSLYAAVLGFVDNGQIMGSRNGDLSANPLGTLIYNEISYNDYSLYFSDSWRIRPSLTLTYGVNWSVDMPPREALGKQTLMVALPSNQIVDPEAYLAARQQAALTGQVYNPTVGFSPIHSTGRDFPHDPVYRDAAPRVAIAWNPKFSGGILGTIFGNGKTVFRGGYARLYDRLNGVQKVIDPLQGLGFSQTLQCLGPSTGGQCLGAAGTDPATAMRIGADGSTVPIPAFSATAPIPLVPGVAGFPGANQPLASTTYEIDPHYRPGPNNSWNATIQRELPGNGLLEVGFVRRTASGLYSPVELNQVPFFMVYGGQSFAQAYDNVSAQIKAGAAVTPQPFFEKSLAGSSFCAAPNASCTAGVVSRFSGNFTTQSVRTIWSGIQPSFVFGPATAVNNQISTMFFWTSQGISNYNAGFISYRIRRYKGITLNANFTYGHSLDDAGRNQDFDTASTNAFNLRYDYGTSLFDRKYVFNLLGMYEVPFRYQGVAGKLLHGWAVAPIFSAYTGLPLKVTDGSSQDLGQNSSSSAGAIALAPNTYGSSVHSGVTGTASTQVAVNGDPARGGTGLNFFGDPNAAFGAFRPLQLSVDTTSMGGILRGLNRWNLDVSVLRRFRINERWSVSFNAQFFNLFNHVLFNDPSVSLQSPTSFGVITSQYNTPRAMQFGLHLDW
ncbi:MAG TPA: carboxypeptidase-like regulatory domain-containing protein [Bryobacteraceae bacterium]